MPTTTPQTHRPVAEDDPRSTAGGARTTDRCNDPYRTKTHAAHSVRRSGRCRASRVERVGCVDRSWPQHDVLTAMRQSANCARACRKFRNLGCPRLSSKALWATTAEPMAALLPMRRAAAAKRSEATGSARTFANAGLCSAGLTALSVRAKPCIDCACPRWPVNRHSSLRGVGKFLIETELSVTVFEERLSSAAKAKGMTACFGPTGRICYALFSFHHLTKRSMIGVSC